MPDFTDAFWIGFGFGMGLLAALGWFALLALGAARLGIWLRARSEASRG